MNPPLPPGSTGFPGVGETLAFLKDPYAFVGDRLKLHGPVFKTSLFGHKTAVIVGAEAAAQFIDPALVERLGSQPDPVYRLFAGPSLPHLDGEAHKERKKIVLQAFTREALASYFPGMLALVEGHLARWAQQSEVSMLAETKHLALQAVAQDIMGIRASEELARLDAWYLDITGAFTSLPLPVPGTGYSRGLKAVAAVLEYYEKIVQEHRQSPKDDGLSRILACTPGLNDDQAARELHHMVIAGRVVYAHLLTVLLELSRHQEVLARLKDETQGELTLDSLHAMKFLQEFVTEVKRTSPVVPGMFGRALTEFSAGGYTIPRGWHIMFGLWESLHAPEFFLSPHTFTPERFGESRQEDKKHEHALVPHGPGQPETSHHCAGTDYATVLVKVFTVALVRDYSFELPPQRLEYNWSQLTPDPIDGLRTRWRKA